MEISDVLFVALLSSLLGSILGPVITEWYKIKSAKAASKYYKKEKCYDTLVTDIVGFRDSKPEQDKKESFYQAYRHLWLYSSDEAIRKVNQFFYSTGGELVPYEERNIADKMYCELMLQLRKDFYGETKLKLEEYQNIYFR